MRVAKVVKGVRGLVGVGDGPVQVKGLLVVVNGLAMAAGTVLDVAEAVKRGTLGAGVVVQPVQRQGILAVDASGVIIAEARGMPAHHVERVSFPGRLAEVTE